MARFPSPRRVFGGGFTLIELLIVVAIIAILAAIAVPNFLEAQTRSKVTRCRADLRTYRNALESYSIDFNGKYPIDFGGGYANEARSFSMLTTPVAYMTSIIYSVFPSKNRPHGSEIGRPELYAYDGKSSSDGRTRFGPYWEPELTAIGLYYFIVTAGPDLFTDFNYGTAELIGIDQRTGYTSMVYDPTNGTISGGDVIATNKGTYY